MRQCLFLLGWGLGGMLCVRVGIAQCYTPEFTVTTVPASARASAFYVKKQPQCAYISPPQGNIISNDSWIAIQSNIWYSTNNVSIVTFTTATNSGAARVGTITAGGLTFTVRQLGATDPLPITGPPAPSLSNLDTLMTNALKEFGALGGALAVSYKGRLVYARGFGYADLATLELVQPDSLFRLASVSKLMTDAAIINLENHNVITPTSKATTILSNITPPPGMSISDLRWNNITVDQLINHTAGFLRTNVDRALNRQYLLSATTALGQNMPGDNISAIRYALSQSLDYTPGQPPNPCPDCYSNFGYSILGRIIEKVSGQTYENYIRNVLMAPAGVTRTRAAHTFYNQRAPGEVWYNASSNELISTSVFNPVLTPALWTEDGLVYEHYDSFGGMISNTMDILRFYIYWLNWGPGSGFYGSLPGTNTGVFTLGSSFDVKYSFLFNYRDVNGDYARTNTASCTNSSPCDLEVAVHNDLETSLSGAISWPSGDLNPQYSGPNPACSFTVNPPNATVAANGGSGMLTVTAPANCGWVTATDAPSWITVGNTETLGAGAANFTVAANAGTQLRTGSITIANQTFIVTQDGSACTVSFAPASPVTLASAAGSSSVNLTFGTTGCPWTASSNASWITGVTASGTGNGSVNYTVAANSGAVRSGTITIAGQTYTVNQSGTGQSVLTASPSALQFGATPGGTFITSQQTVNVQASPGIAWSASSNQNFISVSPTSGTGNGSFTIGIVVSALPASGTVSGIVILTAPGISNSPMVNVTVAIGPSAKPFGSFDTPSDGATNVAGAIPVTGWALDSIEVLKVDIWREPVTNEAAGSNGLVYIGDAVFVYGARPDVQAANPGLPLNTRGGWGYQMLTNFLPNAAGSGPSGNGIYKLHAIAHNKAGASTDLGTKTITVDNAHAAKPFGTIDTPEQGGSPSGSMYLNFGWALTQNPNMIPIDGSTIFVVVDGQIVGNPTYNNFRPDIATLFPGYKNSPGAVGFYYLDTTKLSTGVHTISWNVYDNVGHGDGIGSRYFNVVNGAASVAAPEEEAMERATIDGNRSIEIEELGRVELPLAAMRGYQLLDGERVPIPIGSSLKRGIFYWQPGPGFLGDYTLVFERRDGTETQIHVKIRPKTYGQRPMGSRTQIMDR